MNTPTNPSSVGQRAYAPITPQAVAFLGLGVMGYPMAGHLARAGHRVTVYNRTAAKAAAWATEFGGKSASTPREAAAGADIVFACVGNDDDLRAVTLGNQAGGNTSAFAGMKPGAVFVDHTTASAEIARELHRTSPLGHRSLHRLGRPTPVHPQSANLRLWRCGGDLEAFAQIQPVAAAFAKAVTRVGDSGAGQLAKMVNQVCIAGLVQGLAEALAFGQRAGLDMPLVLDVIGKGAAQSWQMDNRGKTMLQGKFDFGFAVDWMRKDLGLVLEEARRNGAQLPVTALVDQFYAEVQAQGGQRWDTSSLIARLKKAG